MTARLFYVFGSCLKPLFSKYLCKRNKCQIYCRISPEGIKIIYISFKGWGYLIFRCTAKLIVIEVWVPLNSVWLYGVLVLLEKAAGKKLFLFCSHLIWWSNCMHNCLFITLYCPLLAFYLLVCLMVACRFCSSTSVFKGLKKSVHCMKGEQQRQNAKNWEIRTLSSSSSGVISGHTSVGLQPWGMIRCH